MKTVKISKDKLLVKLRENRNDHRQIFKVPLEGWKQTVTKVLESAAKAALDGMRYKTHFHIPMPEDHTPDYDEIIERVEWHEEELIDLEVLEFSRYVRDRWDWQPDFIGLASTYSSSSGSSESSSSALSKKMDLVKGLKSGMYVEEDDWDG